MDFNLDRTVEILRQTPLSLERMLDGLSADWTTNGGDRDNWTPYEILGHLINAEETDWIPRAEVILRQGEDREFPPFDRYAHFEMSKDKTISDLLAAFTDARNASLQHLANWHLTPDQLALKGEHPQFGEVTLSQLLATWAVHDLTHIRQIVTFMAKRYTEAVGPWSEFLSILK